ncbi:MAG: MBOAT family protein [Oscillospiraceae bacterium]|nr:MBOAT family protein [Oscillospiraceae bacterium]
MVFSSVIFIFAYLPIVFLGYYAIPKRYALVFLFVMNLIFYGWGEPVYLLLMVFSIAHNYAAALLIARLKHKKAVLAMSVILNLTLIGFYKYAGFVIDSIAYALPRIIHFAGLPPLPRLDFGFAAPPLPIGISFYTFQAMAYVIDVYRGDMKAERSFLKFGSFISLFPQLIAGPIVLYRDVVDYLGKRSAKLADVERGLKIFIMGLSKKLLLANPVGAAWATFASAPGGNGVAGAWVGLFAYAFHIYFDFSGYSDMAVGMGLMLGFKFPGNFNYPYIANSITDFWRRWHITLSSWFRDYVYIPLGGSRRGIFRNLFNLVVVWFLTGLWHGASWNFVLWGMYFAVILIIERAFLLRVFDKLNVPALVRRLYAFGLVVIGWGLFALTDLSQSFSYIAELYGYTSAVAGISLAAMPAGGVAGATLLYGGMFTSTSLQYAVAYLPTLILCALAATPLPKAVWSVVTGGGRRLRALEAAGAFAMLVLCVAAVTAGGYNPFIYFRF